jgi:hypothetical protein
LGCRCGGRASCGCCDAGSATEGQASNSADACCPGTGRIHGFGLKRRCGCCDCTASNVEATKEQNVPEPTPADAPAAQ